MWTCDSDSAPQVKWARPVVTTDWLRLLCYFSLWAAIACRHDWHLLALGWVRLYKLQRASMGQAQSFTFYFLFFFLFRQLSSICNYNKLLNNKINSLIWLDLKEDCFLLLELDLNFPLKSIHLGLKFSFYMNF